MAFSGQLVQATADQGAGNSKVPQVAHAQTAAFSLITQGAPAQVLLPSTTTAGLNGTWPLSAKQAHVELYWLRLAP